MTSKARYSIAVISIILFIWVTYLQVYEISALVGLGLAYQVWAYFRQGTVALAARAYQKKDYTSAEKLLKEIKNPDRLAKSRRGYYEFIQGNIQLQKGNQLEAETHFQIASRFPLRNENDKGIVLVQLANLNLQKKEFLKAGAYLDVAKDLKLSSRVQSIVQKIEYEIQKAK